MRIEAQDVTGTRIDLGHGCIHAGGLDLLGIVDETDASIALAETADDLAGLILAAAVRYDDFYERRGCIDEYLLNQISYMALFIQRRYNNTEIRRHARIYTSHHWLSLM
ncbi:hypothetical protein GCM10007874_02310 [Labrys miyagiensis]|uniref:Uncharacterized protein n=1 Tax=Labrys miyagiensis TaxID=346912 RepID=A0ABQ6C9Z7_9HYPH|nr:hypothetical protein GCM10007874_02310 [Labrys miyagiensis]